VHGHKTGAVSTAPVCVTRRAAYIKSIIIVALGRSGRADPPNDTGSRNLNQWTIAGAYEFRLWIGLTEVTHRAVVDDPGAAVRPEPDVGRTVESMGASRKACSKSLL
jgi:hypothetical protein